MMYLKFPKSLKRGTEFGSAWELDIHCPMCESIILDVGKEVGSL